MKNIFDVKSDVFTEESQKCTMYSQARYLMGDNMIVPFLPEMQNANNINIFLDENYNIYGGQIGKYTLEDGLHCILFWYENGEYKTKKR